MVGQMDTYFYDIDSGIPFIFKLKFSILLICNVICILSSVIKGRELFLPSNLILTFI